MSRLEREGLLINEESGGSLLTVPISDWPHPLISGDEDSLNGCVLALSTASLAHSQALLNFCVVFRDTLRSKEDEASRPFD